MRRIGVAVAVAVLAAFAAGGSQALARSQATTSVTASAKSEIFLRTHLLWTIKGKVGSPDAACKANRKVKVEFTYEKPPFVKSQVTTAKDGSFTAQMRLNREGEQPQEIKLTVAKATAGGVTCKEATKALPAS